MSAIEQIISDTGTVNAQVTYYTRVPGRAVVYLGAPGQESKHVGNGKFDDQIMPISDARPITGQPTLDAQGFELHTRPTAVRDFYDEDEVLDVYYPEVRKLLTEVTGASKVHIFDHTIRVEDAGKGEAQLLRAPVRMVHNDYTERSGPQRVLDLIDEAEVEQWLNNRFAVINVWRSIGAPVQTTPVALADARSIAADDLIPTDLVYPDRVGEIYFVAHSPAHRWHYFPDMNRDEVMLIKTYDSAQDGRARFTPHTAFEHPNVPAGAPARESIEVRGLVSFA